MPSLPTQPNPMFLSTLLFFVSIYGHSPTKDEAYKVTAYDTSINIIPENMFLELLLCFVENVLLLKTPKKK